MQTRPTSDRLRETLFNILAPRIEGARFLDLCAGTGAVGIEALSRGASQVTFVDQSHRMCELIKTNLEAVKIDENVCEIVSADANKFLKRHLKKGDRPFDLLFYDPPYAVDYEDILNCIGDDVAKFLRPGGSMIVEHHKKRVLAEQFGELRRYRVLKQGDSCLSFYE